MSERDWFYFPIPTLPPDASHVQESERRALEERLQAALILYAHLGGPRRIPTTVKGMIRRYMTKWHPEKKLPEDEDEISK